MRPSRTAGAVLLVALVVVGCNETVLPTTPTLDVFSALATIASSDSHGLEGDVIAISNKPGTPNLDVVISIPRGIENAARKGNAAYSVRVQVTYVSNTATIENLDSGDVPFGNTVFLAQGDKNTVLVLLSIPLGSASPPSSNPGFTGTVDILHPNE